MIYNGSFTSLNIRSQSKFIFDGGGTMLDWQGCSAFVLPGGKVFVFTGILPFVLNEGWYLLCIDRISIETNRCFLVDGMAAVLGHEIAHQVARHSAEKLSFTKILFAIQFTLSLFGVDPHFVFSPLARDLIAEKPFSRKCEAEADAIGLQLMAQACFDPREAVAVWERMERSGKDRIPQFLSTHPSPKNRAQMLEKEVRKN